MRPRRGGGKITRVGSGGCHGAEDPNKYKELIGIAVHSETKCRYCTLFHQEAARLFGATEEEIQEAVHFAKYTVGWSVYLNGIREDYDQFVKELQQISSYIKSGSR